MKRLKTEEEEGNQRERKKRKEKETKRHCTSKFLSVECMFLLSTTEDVLQSAYIQ